MRKAQSACLAALLTVVIGALVMAAVSIHWTIFPAGFAVIMAALWWLNERERRRVRRMWRK